MKRGYHGGLINIGSGNDVTICELVETIMKVVGFGRSIVLNASKPDGTPCKWMYSSKLIDLGWSPRVSLELGV